MAHPNSDKSGQIQPRTPAPAGEQSAADKMTVLINKMTPELGRALPKHVTPERMSRIVLTAIRQNPKLGECTQASFLGCVLSCASLGLEPNTPLGFAYLIPRMNNKLKPARLECSMQIGYQGMIHLANQAGADVFAYIVRQGDDFQYQFGLEPTIHHVPSEDPERENKPITHGYCVATRKDGRKSFTVLTKAQIEKRRERSPAAQDGPWITDYEAMCLKTCVRAHFKWMPKSTENEATHRAIAIEEASERGGGSHLLSAFDPEITRAMENQGIDTTGETMDPATGEMKPTGDGAVNGTGEASKN